MPSLNKAILIGHVGSSPKTQLTKSGSEMVVFSVATEHRFQSSGEWQGKTTWHYVKVFGNRAEYARDKIFTGDLVYVEGRIAADQWQAQDGTRRTFTYIVADKLLRLTKRSTVSGAIQDAADDMQGDSASAEVKDSGFGDLPF